MLIFQRKSSPINGRNSLGVGSLNAPSLGSTTPDVSAKIMKFPSLPLRLWSKSPISSPCSNDYEYRFLDGAGFIQRLWDDANSHFGEVQHLAKRDEKGDLIGIWGAMSDFSGSFLPWEDFRNGLYLAGVECETDAEAPEGWTKWVVPGYEYLCVEREADDTFSQAIKYLKEHNIPLVGAVHDFTDPQTGKSYMYFPVKRL